MTAEILLIIVTAIITRIFSTYIDNKKLDKAVGELRRQRKEEFEDIKGDVLAAREYQEKQNSMLFKKMDLLVDGISHLAESLKAYVLKEDYREAISELKNDLDKIETKASSCGQCMNYRPVGR